MKNTIVCKSCNHDNPFYALNCSKCNSYIRTRIVNIDLWSTISQLFYMPVNTAQLLIFSEHKNYLSLILSLASFKIMFNSVMLINLFGYDLETLQLSISKLFLLSIVPIITIFLISFLITRINNLLGLANRFKDNLTIYSYSFIPIVLVLCILTPVEFALFGSYWFTFNPSPFLMKPAAALVLIGIEGIFLLWGQVLVITSTYAQSKNTLYSIIAGVTFFFALFVVSIYSILSFL